jgi:hypothetical protein
MGRETQFSTKFGVKLSCFVLSFLECFQLISVVAMCTVARHKWRGKKARDLRSWSSLLFIPLPINDLELGAFNFESQYLVVVGLRAHNAI